MLKGWLRAALAGLGLAGAGVAAWRAVLRRPLPQLDGTVRLAGLRGPVEVRRDPWGIPHIYAGNDSDLYFAQGYIHAQDRLWQMELHRRIAAGRLAEIVGPAALEVDRFMRRLGLRRASDAEAAQLDAEEVSVVAAYSAGINAFILEADSRLPLEFMLLRFRPEPWQPADSLAYGRLMALTLSGNWEAQLLRARVIGAIGLVKAAALEPLYPADHPVTVPSGADYARTDTSMLEVMQEIESYVGMSGSNAWAVSGERSATGAPLLANDPHLAPQVPAVWYECHLVTPDHQVTGGSLPGLPGVVIGHNGHIAWGMTASMAAVQDAVIERINPNNPTQYATPGGWETGTLREEVIQVKGWREPVREPVLVTRHGPIVTPMLRREQRPVAVQSVLLEPSFQIEAGLLLNRARNWDEFRAAMAAWPFPSLNFVYADIAGNIGFQMAGRTPLRRKGHALTPRPGWTGEADWNGYVPGDELPFRFNPPEGFVLNSNNKITDDGFPHHIHGEWDTGARARRVEELLRAQERHTIQSFQTMHQDDVSTVARQILDALRAMDLRPMDPATREALGRLLLWNGAVAAESVSATIYEVFRLRLLRNLMAPYLGDLVDDYFGGEIHGLTYSGVYILRASSFVVERLQQREPAWLDGTGSASWDDLVVRTLRQTVEHLSERLGDNPDGWQWGKLHALHLRHTLARDGGPLGRVFNLGSIPLGGDGDTVFQTAMNARDPYHTRAWMPLYRQIIDLGDVRRSVAMHMPGQSGHPGSPHYADLLPLWQRGEYHPMLWDRADVEAMTEHLLALEPSA